jgi:exosortase
MSSVPYLPANTGLDTNRPVIQTPTGRFGQNRLALVALVLGIAVLALRTGERLANGLWSTEEYAYSPMILIAALYLVWRKRHVFIDDRSRASIVAAVVLVPVLAAHAISVLINNITVSVATILIAGVFSAAFVWGWRPLRKVGFAIATAAFCTPLPGSVVAAITFPLKMFVSRAATKVLSLVGMPVERQGVMIELGNYRLLVADACSGLQSMFSLAAVSMVYIALMDYRSPIRTSILIVAIFPISVMANVIRVLALAFITYFMGDAAGQGFLHGFAGILMFAVAFGALMMLDGIMNRLGVAE